jgi:ferredoxin
MTRKLQVEIDYSLCANSQACVYTAPGTFRVEGDKTIVVDPAGDDESAIVDAAVMCPMQAISVRDAETGDDVRP